MSPLGTSATNWSIAPNSDRWWMWSSRWSKNGQGKPKCLDETCPRATLSTTNPHGLTKVRTRGAAVGSRWLTAWAMARPFTLPLRSGKNLTKASSEFHLISSPLRLVNSQNNLFYSQCHYRSHLAYRKQRLLTVPITSARPLSAVSMHQSSASTARKSWLMLWTYYSLNGHGY
jgi:hypothetical protein